MKPQALTHDTVVYYHTFWRCVSCDTVHGRHFGDEGVVAMADNVFVPWVQVFLSDEEAKSDLKRTSKCVESKTK